MTQPSCLGYYVFEVSDIEEWREFATQIVGAQIGRSVEGEFLTLRLDDHESRILLTKGPSDDIVAAGWEFTTQEALEAYVARLKEAGTSIKDGGGSLSAQRRVKKVYTCDDPNGWTHEFYFGPAIAPSTDPFYSPLVGGGFESGRLGVGHFVSVAENAEQTNAFYKDVLGLSVSDYIVSKGVEGVPDLDLTFYHVATGRHHSVAVGEMPGSPKRMNHFMVQTRDLKDVGLAHDRFVEAGIPIILGIGQHPNDQTVSFYALTPSGFAVEIGWGGVVIDDDHWDVMTYSQPSLWGHKPAMPGP